MKLNTEKGVLPTLTRRDAMRAFTGACVLGAAPTCLWAHDRIPLRGIPGTGERLPAIGLGSTKPVRQINEAGSNAIENVLRTLMNYGGTVVDTAPRPIEIDRPFGRVLQKPEFDDALWLASKVETTDEAASIAQIEQTRRLFGRDALDLIQVTSLTALAMNWQVLRACKDAGHARYIGVTVSDEKLYPELEAFMRRESPDFVQLNYSVVEHSAEERLLPLADDMGIAVLVNGPFMNGAYFGLVKGKTLPSWASTFDCETWAHFSLKYILAHPAITCVLTETTNPAHMEDNVRGSLRRFPDDATRRRMRDLIKGL